MTKHVFVAHLPDLIEAHEYASDPKGRRVRVRIRVTESGIEVLGDAGARVGKTIGRIRARGD